MNFTKAPQVNIYKVLGKEWDRIHNSNADRSLKLLGKIWDLENMGSEDDRYDNALEDITQHYYRNQDWTTEFLFIERLKLYNDSTVFQKFVESILAPENYDSSDQLTGISFLISSELEKDKLRLVIEEYNDLGLPIQKVYERAEVDNLPDGVKKNNIPFYVLNDNSESPQEDEYFTLDPNKGWNDYSVFSGFNLAYHKKNSQFFQIGYLKIIHKEEMVTWDALPERFLQLSEDFCSLFNDEDYYYGLKDKFKEQGMVSILNALQDAAYFPDIQDRFERNSNYRASLLRSDAAERLLREMRPKLNGNDAENLYNFSYNFRPAYSTSSVKIDFDFNGVEPLPDRIFAVIGKNGTGKTQLMTALPNSLLKNDPKEFFEKIPSFSKIIAVSYSVFDTFSIPRKNATFNYVYCGLKNEEGEMRSNKGLLLSFHYNWKKIMELDRTSKWRSILKNFLEDDIIRAFIVDSSEYAKEFEVSLEGFHTIRNKLSSGQSILLYIITEVVANIRFDSLILYDEPETHLHPNAIVELMNTIYELVYEFQSFCIIATHSPLVIRELFSKNVYVLERDGNLQSVRRIGIESFGENLGVLSDEVFGDRQMPKQYKKIIAGLITEGKTFDEITAMLEYDEVPLSLNARIFIKNLIRTSNEEF